MKEPVVPDAIELLKIRRSVKPREMSEPGPSPAELETILTIGAAGLPDHGKLTPWALHCVRGRRPQFRAGEVIAKVFARKKIPQGTAADIDVERHRPYRRAPGDWRGQFYKTASQGAAVGAGIIGGRQRNETWSPRPPRSATVRAG